MVKSCYGKYYSQITIHAVFAVKHRQHFITKAWRDQLHQYIFRHYCKQGCNILAVGGWTDHVHILFGMPVTISISDFVGAVKANSSKWINERGFIKAGFNGRKGTVHFLMQEASGDIVIRYIMNQEEHHRKKTFKDEYVKMLADYDVAYQDKYLFDFFE